MLISCSFFSIQEAGKNDGFISFYKTENTETSTSLSGFPSDLGLSKQGPHAHRRW